MEKYYQVQQHEAGFGKFFESKYEELLKSSFVANREDLPNERGIYVIYGEDKKPIYVGRTNKLRERINMHVRDSSNGLTATFAFNLAKKEYGESDETRAALEAREDFQALFREKKKYLREHCSYKALLVENDVLQTMLEPYLAYKLGTYPDLNTFENH